MSRTVSRITDPSDPRIEHYRNIRDRDLAGRDGLFVAEGKVVLRVLSETRRFPILSVLLLENRLAGMDAILSSLKEEVSVYVATAEILNAIAGFDMHRGILAIGRRRDDGDAGTLLGSTGTSLALGLVGLSNHDNMGAVFRNAAAFGADAIVMDGTCCDPLYRKSIRVSVGAALKVPFAATPHAQGLCDALAASGHTLYALTPAGSTDITAIAPDPRSALLLGPEGDGLPGEIIDRAVPVRIDMAAGFDSLNVATACAIALHHFRHRMRRA